MLVPFLAGLAAAAIPPLPTPLPPPRVAATFLIADAYGQRDGRRSDPLADRTWTLLVTLHDLGQIALSDPKQPNSDFDACFPSGRVDDWERSTTRCIGDRLKQVADGAVPVAILVNDTRSRSSAQQLTCIGPAGAIGEAKAHLADLFHPRADIRAGVRNQALGCIKGALGGRL